MRRERGWQLVAAGLLAADGLVRIMDRTRARLRMHIAIAVASKVRACLQENIYTECIGTEPPNESIYFSLRLLTAPLPARCSRPCQVY